MAPKKASKKTKIPHPGVTLGSIETDQNDELAPPNAPPPNAPPPNAPPPNAPPPNASPSPCSETPLIDRSIPLITNENENSERMKWSPEMIEALVECIYSIFKDRKAADNRFKKEL